MRRALLSFAAICVSLSLLLPAFAFRLPRERTTPVESVAARDARLRVFDDVWETVRTRYYDPGMHGLDWVASREKFRLRAAAATGERELYTALR